MHGIADFWAFCAAIVVFLALPGPGTFALLGATSLIHWSACRSSFLTPRGHSRSTRKRSPSSGAAGS